MHVRDPKPMHRIKSRDSYVNFDKHSNENPFSPTVYSMARRLSSRYVCLLSKPRTEAHRIYGDNRQISWHVALIDDVSTKLSTLSLLSIRGQFSGCEVSAGRHHSSVLAVCGARVSHQTRRNGIALDMHLVHPSQWRTMARASRRSLVRRVTLAR